MSKAHNGTVVFLDTETGGLAHSARPWEIGMVIEQPDQAPTHHLWHVIDFLPSKADPLALQFGGFYDRHPLYRPDTGGQMFDGWGITGPSSDVPVEHLLGTEAQLSARLERASRGALIVCCNDSFDVPKIGDMLDRAGHAWGRYYRTVDAYGYAAGAVGLPVTTASAEIAAALAVDREAHGAAHNALVDALFARDLFRATEARVAEQAAP